MSIADVRTDAPSLPRLSPSRLEAWDRCPAAYRFAHVLRLPQPIGDQRPRLLGSVAHALLERYLREALRSGTRPPLTTVSGLAAALVEEGDVPDASTELIREAAELVARWLTQWAVPVEHLVAVEHALAVDASGRRVAWDAPDAFIRGRLDLVGVEQQQATVLDWKSGWVSEGEEGLRVAWARGAWAPRLERISVEYHYLRTGRIARAVLTRADAAETLAWARALASRIALALATPEDPGAFPPRPSTACGTCPWVNRCPASPWASTASSSGSFRPRAGSTQRRSFGPRRRLAGIPGHSCQPTAAPWRPFSSAGLTSSVTWRSHGTPARRGSGTGRRRAPKGVRGGANVPAQAAKVRRERHPVSAKNTVPHEG